MAEMKAALLHYATSKSVPQQSRDEIRVSYDVLRGRAPCNFLVLGLDSPMWSAFNAGGTTLFLEESKEWVQKVLQFAPGLRAHTVRYRTRLDEADDLMRWYRSEPECLPPAARVRGNRRCRLALAELPAEVYDQEWDLIMIDAPRGFFAAAPGRMAAIWSAAVMARGRKGSGDTHVFLHDVDRKVEKAFAMEFHCKKYLVGGPGRLWHFLADLWINFVLPNFMQGADHPRIFGSCKELIRSSYQPSIRSRRSSFADHKISSGLADLALPIFTPIG